MTFQFITRGYPLILASKSPRRKSLLAQIGLPFRSVPGQVTEEGLRGDPVMTSRLLAERKAAHVRIKIDDHWVLGADTIVAIDNTMLGKPRDRKEAKRMLGLLSGREHKVITGFCILSPSGNAVHSEGVVTLVRIKKLTGQEIEAYLNTSEPYGKAGGYAIQGIGSFMIQGISGLYTNVVGLPLSALISALISSGALKSFPLPNDL